MDKSSLKNKVGEILSYADIRINGDRAWDIKVYNEDFYQRVMAEGSLGLGESYMEGWWDCPELDQFFHKAFTSKLEDKVQPTLSTLKHLLTAKILNHQKKSRAFNIGKKHYDLSNDLYKSMLDERMVYTCAYWKDVVNLDEAQEAKLDLVCRKINLQPGQRVLDIGCGWGSFAKFAAETYHAQVVGITVSKEQQELAREMCKGLSVDIRLQDYRDVNEQFDHVISLGMFEHVGPKNYRTYMKVAERCLKPGGLFLLHTIGGNTSGVSMEPWMDKYIFPDSVLPSIKQIGQAIEKVFVMEDWHNFGPYYDKTLMAWFENFDRNWPSLKEKFPEKYDEKFYRMWKYYLLFCAGTFRARLNQLWQVVLSKPGEQSFYTSVR